MPDPLSFHIGKPTSDHLEIQLSGSTVPPAQDYWDGNWINAAVNVQAGAFRGGYPLYLRREDFVELFTGFKQLSKDLGGALEFSAMEQQLAFTIQGDARGHFVLKGIAIDRAADGNRLTFELQFDQTEVPAMVRSLAAVTKAYPVVGAPDA
jgi:hypothetical protein